MEALLQGGAKPRLCNKRGLTPLTEALAAGAVPCAAALLRAGADLGAPPLPLLQPPQGCVDSGLGARADTVAGEIERGSDYETGDTGTWQCTACGAVPGDGRETGRRSVREVPVFPAS